MGIGVSKQFSLQGWDLKKWLVGNKETVKIVVGAIISISVLYPQYAPYFVTGGIGLIVIKALLDVIDFWSHEVAL